MADISETVSHRALSGNFYSGKESIYLGLRRRLGWRAAASIDEINVALARGSVKRTFYPGSKYAKAPAV